MSSTDGVTHWLRGWCHTKPGVLWHITCVSASGFSPIKRQSYYFLGWLRWSDEMKTVKYQAPKNQWPSVQVSVEVRDPTVGTWRRGGWRESTEEVGNFQPDWPAPELLPSSGFVLVFSQRTLLLSRKANTGLPSRGLFFRAQFNIQPGASAALSQMKAFGRMVKG